MRLLGKLNYYKKNIYDKFQGLLFYMHKHRIKAGVLFSFLGFFLAKPTIISFFSGLPFILIGIFLRSWASGHILKGTSLIVSGPYSFTRHPLYIGSFLIGIGFTIISYSLYFLLCFLTYFILFYPSTIIKEEEGLNSKFNKSFQIYKNNVSSFIKKDRRWYLPGKFAKFKFSLFIFNKEYKLIIAVIMILILLSLKIR